MSKIDKSYRSLLEEILNKGYWYNDPKRKDVKRLEIPSYTFRHDFKDGFPAITTKKLNYNNILTELIWFLRGDTNIKYLLDNNCNIWNKDACNYYKKMSGWPVNSKLTDISFIQFLKDNNTIVKCNAIYNYGDLGHVYGHQWRNFNGIDQISNLIKNLREQPLATDHIVNSWNPADLDKMALPPCHYGFQIVVRPLNLAERTKLWNPKNLPSGSMVYTDDFFDESGITNYGFELHWQQRSVDTFLGLPYNIASYATLTLIIEKLTGYKALGIQGDLKKVHLYDNSIDAVKEQLSRDVNRYDKCKLTFSKAFEGDILNYRNGHIRLIDRIIDELKPEDFKLENYESYPFIKVEMKERNNK